MATVAAAAMLAGAIPFACVPPPGTTEAPGHATTPQGRARPARVLLVAREAEASVSSAGPYRVRPTAPGSAVVARGGSLASTVVRPLARGLALGSRSLRHYSVRIVADQDGDLAVNGRRYRGELVVRRDSDQALSVLNVVPLEAYLYSVLGSETYAGWPPEALEAQAIVARSYALWRMAQRRHQDFDLHATVMDQNYLGLAKEDPRLRAAVDRTEGVVLLYQMKLFRCYYHSTCGGHTEAVEAVFPDVPLAPLRGTPCVYCKDSKHYRWRREFSAAELARALRKGGLAVDRVASVEVTARTASGRAETVALECGDGTRRVLRASEFRLKVGPSRLPSTFFEIREQGSGWEFRGRGWGHGVGMCQWGSRGMAQRGYSAAEILRHYYPGAALRRLYGGRGRI
ncbi:MAG: SpoIID/LytB domain-containing protein [Candidatus Brocadiia bacterium]